MLDASLRDIQMGNSKQSPTSLICKCNNSYTNYVTLVPTEETRIFSNTVCNGMFKSNQIRSIGLESVVQYYKIKYPNF